MRKHLLLFTIFTFAIGCKNIGGSGDPDVGKACTLMGSAKTIRVKIVAESSLPSNISVALNGDEVDVDECVASDSFFESSLEVNDGRGEASVVFQLDSDAENYEFYFPDSRSGPASNLMNLKVYTRPTCDDDSSVYQDLSGLQISWEPFYANGEDCSIVGYTADALVEVP